MEHFFMQIDKRRLIRLCENFLNISNPNIVITKLELANKYTYSELLKEWVLEPVISLYVKNCKGQEIIELEDRLSLYFSFEFYILSE